MDLLQLDKQIENGEITIFRLSYCYNCNRDVIKHKKFCCKKCMDEYQSKPAVEKMRDIIKGKK